VKRGPRASTLRGLQAQLAQRGRLLTVIGNTHGAGREQLLNRARITLSLLRAPHDLPGLRVLLGLACGTLVVSESGAGTGAFRPGEHFVTAGPDQLPGTIEYYLTHEAERQKIARQGHAFVTRELTLPNVLRTMLAQAGPRLWK